MVESSFTTSGCGFHLRLINTTRFFRTCYIGCDCNHMYYDLVGPFLQSAFRQCYAGCGSNRLGHENTLAGEISPHIHLYIIADVLSHVLIF